MSSPQRPRGRKTNREVASVPRGIRGPTSFFRSLDAPSMAALKKIGA